MRKRIKYGRLYWLPLEAADIDEFFFVKAFRKLGIMYIPSTLRFYEELYLREDRSKYSRRLINKCRKLGIVTYVVQEGPLLHELSAKFSHLPLYADIFLCPEQDYELWIKEGMPKEKIKTYDMQKFDKDDYGAVSFLEPFITWDEDKTKQESASHNIKILKGVYGLMDKDVVFKPHQAHPELILPFLPPHRIVWGKAEDLIKKYKKVYCFSDSSITKDCEMLGKEYELMDKEHGGTAQRKADGVQNTDSKDCDAIVFLSAFVTWDDLGFTWRKDHHNIKILKGVYGLMDKDVVFKPHQAHPELILPFLPPHRIVWGKAEDLIKKYKKVYCFSDSSITKDCEMLGKEYELVDK